MKNTASEQIELGIRNQIRNSYRNVRSERQKRARWWFTKMRQAVDLALPPQPIPSPRPTQTYLQMHQTDLLLSDQK